MVFAEFLSVGCRRREFGWSQQAIRVRFRAQPGVDMGVAPAIPSVRPLMRIIKYFFEEPTLLDFPAPESAGQPTREGLKGLMRQHRHYRGYLAASDLENDLVGGSSLEDNAAAEILARSLDGPIWFSNRAPGQEDVELRLLTDHHQVVQALSTMASDSVMILEIDPSEEIVRALTEDNDRKSGMKQIAELLDRGCTLVFPEQSHMGHDWSIFSSHPMAERLQAAMADLPKDTRGFVIPYVEARGEHKFYFEQYDTELFARHEVTG